MVRAALLGLCGGLLLGSLFLLVLGVRTYLVPMDCAGLSEQECGLTREAATTVGRVQTVGGAALLALGIAVALILRSSRPPPPPSATP